MGYKLPSEIFAAREGIFISCQLIAGNFEAFGKGAGISLGRTTNYGNLPMKLQCLMAKSAHDNRVEKRMPSAGQCSENANESKCTGAIENNFDFFVASRLHIIRFRLFI